MIGCGALDPDISTKLKVYLHALEKRLGVQPPIAMFVALLNCDGARISIGREFDSPRDGGIDRNRISPPEVVLLAFKDFPIEDLKPALDALWNADGWECSPYFDDDDHFRDPFAQ